MTSMDFTVFKIAAICVSLVSSLYMVLRKRFDKPQSKILLVIIADMVITALSDTVAKMVRAYAVASPFTVGVEEIAGYVYFIVHTALGPLFVMYVLSVCSVHAHRNAARNNLIAIPFFLLELIAVTNPLTHWVYWYGADLSFNRGWAVYVFYAVGVFYLFLGIYQLFAHWRALTPLKRKALIFFFLMTVLGVGLQLAIPAFCVELFAESLAVLGVVMFVENEDEFIDTEIGVHNRQALKMTLDSLTALKKPFCVLAVRVSTVEAFSRVDKTIITQNAMAEILAEYFKSVAPWYHIYRTAPTSFALLDPNMDEQNASNLAREIARRFGMSWKYGELDIELHAVVALANVPRDLATPDDVFYLIDTSVPHVAEGTVLQGVGLNYLMRRAEVERAVQRGFEENEYEVHYQPVLNADGSICAAEALMRLNDKVLGNIPPDEFIEAAERIAAVESIGEFALRQACAFLESGVPQKLGIDHINVNLSVIECMQTDFADRVCGIVSEYNIDPSLVGFEITESVAASNYESLEHAMGRLKHNGHSFAMDDYGTGYSNVNALLVLDFDLVKIDKSVLWEAEKSDIGMTILETSVEMLRNTGRSVLVEGVETAEQAALLHRLGIDYYQGFYYAKPMPKDDFVAFAEHRPA